MYLYPDPGNIYIVYRYTYVEIGIEAAQFLFWKYKNVICVAMFAVPL
jgi:hypothetical protein